MNRKRFLFFLLLACSLKLWAGDVTVTDFGAKGDSLTLNTLALQKAIDACSESGGGKVIVPAGKYISGTLLLKNNVTLLLHKNAVILGSLHVEDYQNPDPFADGLGIDVGWALVAAVDVQHIGIEGEGSIDGRGAQLKEEQIRTDTRPESQRWGRRPFLLRVVRCTDVRVRNITLLYAAAWTSHYFQCRNVLIENLRILSKGVAHNDGIDIDGCQQVQIRNCDIVSGDDALCFKTTSSKMACSDIEVSGMKLRSNQGAMKMGTESMAPFENIRIRDCYIYNTNNGGIKLLTVDGAHLRNIEISDIRMDEVKTPILIRLGARLSVFRKNADTQQPVGTLENVVLRNIKARASDSAQLRPPSGILITGVPGHSIHNLTLDHIEIELAGGGTAEQGRQAVPEAVDKYPEVKTFGPTIPAYGIWARHVNGLHLSNVVLRLKSNDLRPAILCEDVSDLDITHSTLPETSGSEAVIRLEGVQGARIEDVSVKGSARALVRVEGGESRSIRVRNNHTPGISQATELASDLKPETLVRQ